MTKKRTVYLSELIDLIDSEDPKTIEVHGKTYTQVIRCKDCKWWKEYCRIVDGEVSDHACSLKRETDGNMHRAKADDYCSWAERKEE